MRHAAVVGLVWFVAAAAQAQAPASSGPRSGPSVQAPAPCSLVLQTGDQFTQTPLVGFDPSVASRPLPAPPVGAKSAVVLCTRATLIPELTDYRILTEMHLPLAIRAGARTLFLGVADGRLQVGVQNGEITAEEKTALEDRLRKMQDAMAAKAGTKRPAK